VYQNAHKDNGYIIKDN